MSRSHGSRWVAPGPAAVGSWVRERVADVVGVEVVRIRPWSTQAVVTTRTGGRSWFKAPHPSLAHEAALLRLVDVLAPGAYVVPSVADERGWMLTPDGGSTLAGQGLDVDDWCRLVAEAADVQRRTARAAADGVLAALGVPEATPGRALDALDRLADERAALGGATTREITDLLVAGRERVGTAAALLAGSPVGVALDPADLHAGNVLARRRADGRLCCLDLGDAQVSHPFAALTAPLTHVTAAHGSGAARRVRDCYLEVWSDLVDRRDAVHLLPAADVLSGLGRARTWWGVLADASAQDVATWSVPALRDLGRLARPPAGGGSMEA